MPEHVGVREAHAPFLVRQEEPVVVHLFRQLDVRDLEELGAAPASAVVEEAHEGVSDS